MKEEKEKNGEGQFVNAYQYVDFIYWLPIEFSRRRIKICGLKLNYTFCCVTVTLTWWCLVNGNVLLYSSSIRL